MAASFFTSGGQVGTRGGKVVANFGCQEVVRAGQFVASVNCDKGC
jgi:hypothetical protein